MILQSHYLANTVTINVHGGRKSNLTKHITSVHEGEKPWIKFDCSYCDKKFQKATGN